MLDVWLQAKDLPIKSAPKPKWGRLDRSKAGFHTSENLDSPLPILLPRPAVIYIRLIRETLATTSAARMALGPDKLGTLPTSARPIRVKGPKT